MKTENKSAKLTILQVIAIGAGIVFAPKVTIPGLTLGGGAYAN